MKRNRLFAVIRLALLSETLVSLNDAGGSAIVALSAGIEAIPPPVIERFDSDAQVLERSRNVQLCFRVRNAQRLAIEPAGSQPQSNSVGCVTRFVGDTTTFRLTASGEGGPPRQVSSTLTVRVAASPTGPPKGEPPKPAPAGPPKPPPQPPPAGPPKGEPPKPPPMLKGERPYGGRVLAKDPGAVGIEPRSQGAPPPRKSPGRATVPIGPAVIPAFPWPPPAASAEHQIRNTWVTKGEHTKLSDVAETLEAALEDASYETWRYSSVPRGFALVTQIEQIRPDGTPRSGKERFRTDLPSLGDMTFVEFLKALATAPPGYYRVIVFVVTNTPFSQADKKPTEDEAQHWLNVGLNQLPKSIGMLTYGEDYRTTALIYEFKKRSRSDPAIFVPKSLESGRTHLEKARIWDALTR